jgi:hypothetical protein
MPRLVLTEEQTKMIYTSAEPIRICGSDGSVFGVIPPPLPWSDEEIAEAKRALASGEPGYTFKEVMAHLHSLEHSKDP